MRLKKPVQPVFRPAGEGGRSNRERMIQPLRIAVLKMGLSLMVIIMTMGGPFFNVVL